MLRGGVAAGDRRQKWRERWERARAEPQHAVVVAAARAHSGIKGQSAADGARSSAAPYESPLSLTPAPTSAHGRALPTDDWQPWHHAGASAPCSTRCVPRILETPKSLPARAWQHSEPYFLVYTTEAEGGVASEKAALKPGPGPQVDGS